jgi:hypothetical protein
MCFTRRTVTDFYWNKASALPNALEDNFRKVGGRYRSAANRVDFIINNEKQIVGIMPCLCFPSPVLHLSW